MRPIGRFSYPLKSASPFIARSDYTKPQSMNNTIPSKAADWSQRKAPVTLGVHSARAYLRHHLRAHRPVAVIFLDLSEAFYRVVRPLALGGRIDDAAIAQMAMRLNLPDSVLADLHRHLQQDCATARAGLPDYARRALQAIHMDTHWSIGPQSDVCSTSIGTRPGDAYADVVFGYLWSRVLQQFQQEAGAEETFGAFPASADQGPELFQQDVQGDGPPTLFVGPCWMDDLCVALSANDCETLLRKARHTTRILIDQCLGHAMTPNLAQGKTELLLALCGPGARHHKVALYGPTASKDIDVVGEHSTYKINLVGQYHHLGCTLHHRGDLRAEIRRRIGLAHKAFSDQRRVLFHNAAIPLAKRVELFQSLVLSKFLYGADSWVIADRRTKQTLHAALIRLYRRLLKCPGDQHLSDDQILLQTGLPSPSELLRIQRLRYLGSLLACNHLVD